MSDQPMRPLVCSECVKQKQNWNEPCPCVESIVNANLRMIEDVKNREAYQQKLTAVVEVAREIYEAPAQTGADRYQRLGHALAELDG